jgi:hypothetical protein
MGEWTYRSTILDLALDGGKRPATPPGHYAPAEISPCTYWRGSWVGLRAGMDAVE